MKNASEGSQATLGSWQDTSEQRKPQKLQRLAPERRAMSAGGSARRFVHFHPENRTFRPRYPLGHKKSGSVKAELELNRCAKFRNGAGVSGVLAGGGMWHVTFRLLFAR